MKIVSFKSGLGNQVFYYLMTQYLKEKCPGHTVYGNYNRRWLTAHNGLELQTAFKVDLPASTRWSDFITLCCRAVHRFMPSARITDSNFTERGIYYDGWWHDKRFFLDNVEKLEFQEPLLTESNREYIRLMEATKSVALHVRRGDYLLPQFRDTYGGICTLEYYNEAIGIIKQKMSNPHFFVFSNDLEWVKENLCIENATYVSGNSGIDSWMDMYLMSHCKANIIANSTFSYWGARLNKNANGGSIVIYPKCWINNHPVPDIFPDGWIGL